MVQISDLSLKEIRRELHKYPEAGWKEFRTTALLAEELDTRGFTLYLGKNAVNPEKRLGVPDEEELKAAKQRAEREGTPTHYLKQMGLVTGLVAEKSFGDGPVVGLRVDMDALERSEASDDSHRPAREGFASQHPGVMHACGHDGHTVIGLGVARELDDHGGFNGTLKLFFQPAEEGGRGGKPMSETEHLNDIEYFFSLHIGIDQELGTIVAAYDRPLPNTKLDAVFTGQPSHAGAAPNEGRNALQAATTAIQNLYAIPRHKQGATRINVGRFHSDNPQNVISEKATMRVEVRGETVKLNDYMLKKARKTVKHAAKMHETKLKTSLYGKTTTFTADEELVEQVVNKAEEMVGTTKVKKKRTESRGSEDASFLIKQVQEQGGKATYVGFGASNPYGHHTARFDVDEKVFPLAVELLTTVIRSL